MSDFSANCRDLVKNIDDYLYKCESNEEKLAMISLIRGVIDEYEITTLEGSEK